MKEEREVHGRYVNILTDAGFKAVFGDRRNADLLREFLNVVLPGRRKVHMTSIRCILWVFLPMIFIIQAPGGRIRTFLTTPSSSAARMSCFVRQFRLPLWN